MERTRLGQERRVPHPPAVSRILPVSHVLGRICPGTTAAPGCEPALPGPGSAKPGSAEPGALHAAPGWGPRAAPPAVAPAEPRGPFPSFQLQQGLQGAAQPFPALPGTAGAHLARGHRWSGAPAPRCPPVGRARPAPPRPALGGSAPGPDPGSDPDPCPGPSPGPDPARPGPAGQKRGPRRQGAWPPLICIPAELRQSARGARGRQHKPRPSFICISRGWRPIRAAVEGTLLA